MSNIVSFRPRPPKKGNGAREALISMLKKADDPGELADNILALLWLRGYKIVPVDEEHCA